MVAFERIFKAVVCLMWLICGQFSTCHAFSECRVTISDAIPEPYVPYVSNCIQLLAYAQSKGENIYTWCQNPANFQRCCLTCQNYQRLACQDTAYEPDCKLKASQGLCNTYLQNGYPVYSFCQKSCGRCNPYLTCDNCGTNTCNGGTCIQTNVFTIPTIQCICKPDRGGTYCQSMNPCLSNPCMNGGQCLPSYDDVDATYKCNCAAGCSGTNCQICQNKCYPEYCLNGGYCAIDNVGLPYCVCQNGYYGPYCEKYAGSCSPNPCLNNGQCIQMGTDFKCNCPPNYSGKRCNFYISIEICMRGDIDPSLCQTWRQSNMCNFIYLYQEIPVPLYCPQSCMVCSSYPLCVDKDANCPIWASMGICNLVTTNYPDMCRRSCNCCSYKKKK